MHERGVVGDYTALAVLEGYAAICDGLLEPHGSEMQPAMDKSTMTRRYKRRESCHVESRARVSNSITILR